MFRSLYESRPGIRDVSTAALVQGSGAFMLMLMSGLGVAVTAMEEKPSVPNAPNANGIPRVPSGPATTSPAAPTKGHIRRFMTQKSYPPGTIPPPSPKVPHVPVNDTSKTVGDTLSTSTNIGKTPTRPSPGIDSSSSLLEPFSGPVFAHSIGAVRGHRDYMEDFYDVAAKGRFAAVYDGHGGDEVSRFLKNYFYRQIINSLNLMADTSQLTSSKHEKQDVGQVGMVAEALKTALAVVERSVLRTKAWCYQGSTLAACVIVNETNSRDENSGGDMQKNRMFAVTANIGDSRIVLSRAGQAVELTEDHKPNLPRELKRIRALGGNVRWYGMVSPEGRPVEGTGVYRVNGNLAVSRAIGDAAEKPFVSPLADIRITPLNFTGGDENEIGSGCRGDSGDEFIVVATDGLWDVMTSYEVVQYVHRILARPIAVDTRLKYVRRKSDGADNGHGQGAPYLPSILSPTTTMTAGSASIDEGVVAPDAVEVARRKENMGRYLTEEALRRGTFDNVACVLLWLK
jgi:serine/threonine protein phosphatase PrpC